MLDSGLEVEVEPDLQGRVVVLVRGPLDLPEAADLRTTFTALCEHDCPDVVVDLTDVSFIGSSGLGAIAGFRHELDQKGRSLVLRGASPGVRRAFEITHLDRVIVLEPDEDEVGEHPTAV